MCGVCRRKVWDSYSVLVVLFYAFCCATCLGLFIQTTIEKNKYEAHLCTPTSIALTPCSDLRCSYLLMSGKTEQGEFVISKLCENRNSCLYVLKSPVVCYLYRGVWMLEITPDVQLAFIVLAILNAIGIVFTFIFVLREAILHPFE